MFFRFANPFLSLYSALIEKLFSGFKFSDALGIFEGLGILITNLI